MLSLSCAACLLFSGVALSAGTLQQVLLSGTAEQPAAIPAYGSDHVAVATPAFEAYIQSQMKEWHVPGLAMAILDGDKTWSRGFGHATLNKDAVTPSTLFCCGSMTKSLTAAAVSLLVDESSSDGDPMTWATPMSELLPGDFVLSDAWATKHITVADMLSHRTGYPRHDFAGPFGNSSATLVRSLRHLPATQEPRAKWQYNNFMYAAAGYLVERRGNYTSLAACFRDRLWRPMQMLNTYLHPDEARRSQSTLATAYFWDNDTQAHRAVPLRDETSSAGAGMAISSVLDWSRYLRHMMDGTGPMSSEGHAALRGAHMVVADKRPPFTGPLYYGFGWFGTVFRDEPVWWHDGWVNTMQSLSVFIPGRQFGFVIMMNAESMPTLQAIMARTLYDYFDVDEKDRFDMDAHWRHKIQEGDDSLGNCSARLYPDLPSPATSLLPPLKDFAGRYTHPGYGATDISLECDGRWVSPADSPARPSLTNDRCMLVIRRASLFGKRVSYRLQHVSGDFWLAWYFNEDYTTVRRPQDCSRAQFRMGADGRPAEMGLDIVMEGEDIPLIWFQREVE